MIGNGGFVRTNPVPFAPAFRRFGATKFCCGCMSTIVFHLGEGGGRGAPWGPEEGEGKVRPDRGGSTA